MSIGICYVVGFEAMFTLEHYFVVLRLGKEDTSVKSMIAFFIKLKIWLAERIKSKFEAENNRTFYNLQNYPHASPCHASVKKRGRNVLENLQGIFVIEKDF